jgi:queuine tRNA-ribosyltransferase
MSSRYENFSFAISYRDPATRARCGTLSTPHGALDTPNFIFCGTKAAIKGLTIAQMREAGADFILANTYHLMIQPGAELVEKMGGLHKFMGWDGPMLTDSGGFQVFSMQFGVVADEVSGKVTADGMAKKSRLSITEEGAAFRSYLDGRKILLTPEYSIDLQRRLGADFIVQFDECAPLNVPREYIARSMGMSQRWGDRSLAEFDRGNNGKQALYGVVQGGVYADLRAESAAYTQDRDFFGTAIGGLLGDHQLVDIVSACVEHIHPDRPVHLLGIGGIKDVFNGVRLGADTLDCVSPTRLARHGWALVEGAPNERLNLRNARFREDQDQLDPNCACYACRTASRAYIHHLLRASELTGLILLSLHNVATMARLLREVRAAIPAGTLDAVQQRWLPQ